MNFVILCHICGTEYTAKQDICSCCGCITGAVSVHPSLVKVVKLLIARGIGVIDTDIRLCTTHKTKVIIQLTGNIPTGLFSDLPIEWQINNLSQLRCSEIDSIKMIKDLEDWAMSKDPDGFKSLLKLSGYDIGI